MKRSTKKLHRSFFELVCVMLVICITFGTLPLWASEEDGAAAESKPEKVQVVVAVKDIPQGTYITDDYIKVISITNSNIPKNIISDMEDVMTHYATEHIYAGEYIGKLQVSERRVSKVSNDSLVQEIVEVQSAYVVVTDFIKPNTGKDITALVQELIDKNPKRTIYFPDGEYVFGSTVTTHAAASKSVSIQLSDGAVIKASDKWSNSDGSYLISMGGSGDANDIVSPGSYYSFMGGTLDGNGEANGLQVAHGRESLIRNVCIKNVINTGICVEKGSNNGSSDIDFEDITIIGNHDLGSVGLKVIGYDNTFTNFRIYNMETGASFRSGGNLIKNFNIYNTDPAKSKFYTGTVGISTSDGSSNWVSECLVVNQATAYAVGTRTIFYDNVAKWDSDLCTKQTAIKASAPYMSISGLKAEFFGEAAEVAFLELKSGADVEDLQAIECCTFDTSLVDDKLYEKFLKFDIMPLT